jgi:Protein of unknown function (DUF1266)
LTELLQNPPGERDYIDPASVTVSRILTLLAINVAAFALAMGLIPDKSTAFFWFPDYAAKLAWFPNSISSENKVIILWGITLALVAYAIYQFVLIRELFDNKLKIIAQYKYYKLAGLNPLPHNKRMALKLYAHRDFEEGHWSETLELFPTQLRFAGKVPSFRFFTSFAAFKLKDKKESLTFLKEWWSIDSPKKYKEIIEELLNGMHSVAFAYEMQYGEDKNALIAKISKDVEWHGISPEYVKKCVQIQNRQAPKLVWGFDLFRVIQVARWAYTAGLASEDEAWADILAATNMIYGLFDSDEDYLDNYILGLLFWAEDKQRARHAKHQWKLYKKNCKWPIAQLAWPKRPSIVWPEAIQTGFKDFIAQAHETHLEESNKKNRK